MNHILMHVNSFSETGTSTALIEYVKELQKRGYLTTVAFEHGSPDNHQATIEVVKEFSDIYPYKSFSELNRNAKNFDLAYFLKSGENDGKIIKGIPNAIHAVFQQYEEHGEAYAYISQWLANTMSEYVDRMTLKDRTRHIYKTHRMPRKSQFDFVPLAVKMPKQTENIRKKLKIPQDARLGIRYGGLEKFDIPWVHNAVSEILDRDRNNWFLFVNTNEFITHDRVVYRPAIVNLQEKSNFLNSADYFLHARRRGESFGMAILESIACGLPTFAWSGGKDQHHTFLLGKDSLYDSQEDLLMKISNLANYKDISRNSDKSKEFLPGPVISKFIAVFIKPLLMEGGSLLHPYEI